MTLDQLLHSYTKQDHASLKGLSYYTRYEKTISSYIRVPDYNPSNFKYVSLLEAAPKNPELGILVTYCIINDYKPYRVPYYPLQLYWVKDSHIISYVQDPL